MGVLELEVQPASPLKGLLARAGDPALFDIPGTAADTAGRTGSAPRCRHGLTAAQGRVLQGRRVNSQTLVGLLVDRGGFLFQIGCFEGNKAETATIIPIIKQVQARHCRADMVVVADADADMLSAGTCASWTRRTFGSLSVPG